MLTAGGLPLEFPTLSLGEEFMKPSAMLYRNLMAMEVEETLRSNPIDGVVLLCNCDKTTPAQLMAAASADLPAIQLNGGPRSSSRWRGAEVGTGTDLWKYWDELRAGRITERGFRRTRSLSRLLGRRLQHDGHRLDDDGPLRSAGNDAAGDLGDPGDRLAPRGRRRGDGPPDRRAGPRGSASVADSDARPPSTMRSARCLALGGSTNAVIHLIAIAGRRNIDLSLDRFDELARDDALSGEHEPVGQAPDGRLFRGRRAACPPGGDSRSAASRLPDRHRPIAGRVAAGRAGSFDRDVIRPRSDPLLAGGSLAVVRGNLAPIGAVIKTSAATPALLKHRGARPSCSRTTTRCSPA